MELLGPVFQSNPLLRRLNQAHIRALSWIKMMLLVKTVKCQSPQELKSHWKVEILDLNHHAVSL